jgi:PhzF family phenazine biosynthesis protein
MTIPVYQVDAFTDKVFGGNPAAVCPLQDWLTDDLLQKIAQENNLSETAYFVERNGDYDIRWFTPEYEIDLCGHATLAAAFVLFNSLQYPGDSIRFHCKSGLLTVSKAGNKIVLNFPARIPEPCEPPDALLKGIHLKPKEIRKSRDYFLVMENEAQVRQVKPDFNYWNQLDVVGVIVTAKGENADFVSRFFVPNSVIGEDPVTGSAHCNLIPYWSEKLGKTTLFARQLSAREGSLWCEHLGERVTMAGEAVCFMKGTIELSV